jgi:hypothetical protein
MTTEVTASVLSPIALVELDFDSLPLNLWSGIGDLSWDSKTWAGAGNLLSFGSLEETTEVRALGTSITISGLNSSILSAALSEDYQGRNATIWLGTTDETGAVIPDPIIVFGGRMDVMTINESAEDVTLNITIENRLIDFERTKIRRYTDQDQKIDYPDDKGFEFVSAIQDKEIVWGRR